MEGITWFEVWWDYSSFPPELLLLVRNEQNQRFAVVEPGSKGQVLHECASYDEAMFWLSEDEYTKVDGRIWPEIWPDAALTQNNVRDGAKTVYSFRYRLP